MDTWLILFKKLSDKASTEEEDMFVQKYETIAVVLLKAREKKKVNWNASVFWLPVLICDHRFLLQNLDLLSTL